MREWLLLSVIVYLIAMFLLAQVVERNGKKIGAFQYAMSLMVYCTAWTYYGSIGSVSENGLSFLAVYMGPVISIPIWSLIGKRIIRVAKAQRISTLADIIASRYGKDRWIEVIVASFSLLGIIPYISLQIKAIAESYSLLADRPTRTSLGNDPALYLMALLLFFTLVFGTRFLQANKSRKGMVSVIAFESIFKLAAILIGTVFVFSYFFVDLDSFLSLFNEASIVNPNIFRTPDANWFWMMLVSALAFMLLPRQFQMGVVENTDVNHLKHAAWIIPLYLLLINLPIIPISLLGEQQLSRGISSEYSLLELSKTAGSWVAGIVFLGGFSAATSMIIVSSIALGNMLSTNLVLPALLRRNNKSNLNDRILFLRRLALSIVFVLAFLIYRLLRVDQSLVSIGMVSFIAFAQFAPAFFGGLFWRRANKIGARTGIISGMSLWFILLLLPTLGAYDLEQFFFKINMNTGLSATGFTALLSLMINGWFFVSLSLLNSPTQQEILQAELFVGGAEIEVDQVNNARWESGTPFRDIKSLLIRFLGDNRTSEVLDRYARINKIDWEANPSTDSRMASYAERLLTEAIGPSSAHIMVKQVVPESRLQPKDVVEILEESRAVHKLNRELRIKQGQLKEASNELQNANEKLVELSHLKDDFLYTVTHELRSPLAAIRSQAELVRDIQDMPVEDRADFLDRIVQDCDRLTRLINDVLDLEKFESGNLKLSLSKQSISHLIDKAEQGIAPLLREKELNLVIDIAPSIPSTYFDGDRIHQVLINLLSNAVKHSPSKSIIRMTLYQVDNNIKCVIADQGSGINLEDKDRVFDKFYQVKNQTRRKPSGSGLGLAICKNIIEKHQGEIWLEINLPKGTRAIFTLPIYHSDFTGTSTKELENV